MTSVGGVLNAAKLGAKCALSLYVCTEYVVDIMPCHGASMLPTISALGDSLLIDRTFNLPSRVSRWLERSGFDTELRTGDLVILRNPVDPSYMVLKRISQTWTDDQQQGADGQQLPKYHVSLLGDNLAASRDSREYGSVPVAMIEGRAVLRVWPLSTFGRLSAAPSSQQQPLQSTAAAVATSPTAST